MFSIHAPLTGDNSQIMMYAIIGGVAVVAMAGLIVASVIARKKKEKENSEK